MMENILEVKNLSKKYKDFELKSINFKLKKGIWVSLAKMELEKQLQLKPF